ncbi:MAG TPA: hypothetical protein VGD60_05060 [Candidatus Acidoferrales bacterium]
MNNILQVLALVVVVVSPSIARAAPVCWFGTKPCFVACSSPPTLTDAEQAVPKLRAEEYGKINWFDQGSAALTTQFFKCAGIQGWRLYGFRVYAIGTIQKAATSWDGLRTVDLTLQDFNGSPAFLTLTGTHYIRAEIVRRVWKKLDFKLVAGEEICVEGELHWDGDQHGFLEIHPSKVTDVQLISAPGPGMDCSKSK